MTCASAGAQVLLATGGQPWLRCHRRKQHRFCADQPGARLPVRAVLAPPGVWPARKRAGRTRRQSCRLRHHLWELRPDHAPVLMADGSTPDSDEFFRAADSPRGQCILAVTKDSRLPALFAPTPWRLDISIDRRAMAFCGGPKHLARRWHPLFEQAQTEYGFDLSSAASSPRES